MKFYLNWLKEYIDINIQPIEIASKLTLAGVEVTECRMVGIGFEKIVTAEILKIRKHPNADKLLVCQVSNGREIVSVVCGADNVKEKDKVPLALEGAELPGGIKIKNSKIRGELSCGMLCSATELKIGNDAAGIYILPKDTPLGRDLSEYLNLKNWAFELEVAPNRGDLLGVIGIAREVGALTNRRVKLPELANDDGKKTNSSGEVTVEVMDSELCPRYTAAVVKGIKVGESPQWLKKHLEGAGIRSINNIVDITNFVMMEWGQPLHAFDLSKILGKKIVVRRAKQGEKIKTLDGVNRNLEPVDLVICDVSKPVAIAGIMGGSESEISFNTRDVILESAYFDPRNIRRTSKKLGLSSESSYRFERGVDPEGVRKALLRAVSLIEKLDAGRYERGIIDVYPNDFKNVKMILKSSKVERVLGIAIPPQKIKEILEGLGMDVKNYGDVDFEVSIPTFRGDIKQEYDLIEEVARIFGYHLIPTTLPETLAEPEFFDPKKEVIKNLANFLVGCGFTESRNYSFISSRDNSLFVGADPKVEGEPLRILNPLSEGQSIMRQNLLPSLLRNISYHKARNIEDVKIFEIDRTFNVFNHQCVEKTSLTLALTGRDYNDRWDYKGRVYDFYDVKGLFEEIASRFKIDQCSFRLGSARKYMHPRISSDVILSNKTIGTFGMIHPDILKYYEIGEVYVLETSIEDFTLALGKVAEYRYFSKFPSIKRDFSIIVDEKIRHEDIMTTIKKIKSDLIRDMNLFDYYKGNQVPEGKKSLSYRVTYQSFDKTLTEDEVNSIHDRIIATLVDGVKAELRK